MSKRKRRRQKRYRPRVHTPTLGPGSAWGPWDVTFHCDNKASRQLGDVLAKMIERDRELHVPTLFVVTREGDRVSFDPSDDESLRRAAARLEHIYDRRAPWWIDHGGEA